LSAYASTRILDFSNPDSWSFSRIFIALPLESSQLDLKRPDFIGTSSVWPSMATWYLFPYGFKTSRTRPSGMTISGKIVALPDAKTTPESKASSKPSSVNLTLTFFSNFSLTILSLIFFSADANDSSEVVWLSASAIFSILPVLTDDAVTLSFVRINIGMYPEFLMQIDFQEQWGRRNQHISGITLSLVGPIGAIGMNYRYLLPQFKRADLGLGIFFPLQNFVLQSDDAADAITSQVYQVMASWAFADSYGLFVDMAFGGETIFTVGFSFYNPMFFPFLL